jgi:transcriptional regulator with XRE-family HTH domain
MPPSPYIVNTAYVRALRVGHGWTLNEVARRARIRLDTYEHFEQGTRHPNARTVQRIAQVYAVDPRRLLRPAQGGGAPT